MSFDNIYPEVPVMYDECKTLRDKLIHRIRRCFEKLDDHGYITPDYATELMFNNIMVTLRQEAIDEMVAYDEELGI